MKWIQIYLQLSVYLFDFDLPSSKYCILSHHTLFKSFSKRRGPTLIEPIDLTFQRFGVRACYTIASEQTLYWLFLLGFGIVHIKIVSRGFYSSHGDSSHSLRTRISYKYLCDRTASINDINQSEFELGTQSPGDEVGDKSGKQTEGTDGGRTCNKCSV